MPSTSPMRRSVSTTSKGSAPSRSSAAAPPSASATSKPAWRSTMAVVTRMFRWSSTTSTRPALADGAAMGESVGVMDRRARGLRPSYLAPRGRAGA